MSRYVENFDSSRLRELRKSRGITQTNIEKGTGIKKFVYSRIEQGKRGITEEELKKLADFFGVDISYFITSFNDTSARKEVCFEDLKTILEKLSTSELKLLLKEKGVKKLSGLRKNELVRKTLEVYENRAELFQKANELYNSKIMERIKDGLDHFYNDRVGILYVDAELVKADVNGRSVVIYNPGREDSEYRCDDSCQDYVYNVKSGRIPFCKHYISVIAALVYNGNLGINDVCNLRNEHKELIKKAIERKKKEEGILEKGREIEKTLEEARRYYLKIACQDEIIARKVFKDSAEKVFEEFTLKMFNLLEFETISNRNPHGWDGIIIGIHSTPPFIVVLECKTAQSGIYDYIAKHQEYLLNLKMYAVDMVKDKLFGTFRNYVKYVAVVAPGFPKEVESLKYSFQNMTGMLLSFIPGEVLLYFVERYRETPILTHAWMEDLFREGGLWTIERVDKAFERAETMINILAEKVEEKILDWMRQYISIKSDAAFINFDMPMFEELSREFFQALSPELVITGRKEVTGVETIRLRHDYYAVWERVLSRIGKMVINYLQELSDTQERTTEMKSEIIRQLRIS